ncbi:tetratricopeptide repeat protein [Craterilacuibacter sp. RT1T]|uniref:tetratricopeptide repeat protein n=1 Tax=Craterilacuibacter sp. RT1T TaxID=2942211 RepID=UPI0020BEDF49|nr:tetratricopeptide repeat protein [Craterilacuibacter sp. RT1T]MCL6264252.1 tetratricopeptide repeat protein [Craterilacuibacter sp. RT1T]
MKPHSALLPLFTLLALSGCASSRLARIEPGPASVAVSESARAEAALPHLPLSPQLFYGVIISEIAAQRGGAGASAQTYLELAREARDPRLAQRAAEFAMLSGQLETASQALTLWVELDPASENAREQLFIALLRSGKLAQSRPLIEGLLADRPERAPAVFVQLARLTARQPDKAAAYQLTRDLAARYPDLPEARFALLAVAAEAGDQMAMAQEMDALARLAPKWDLPVAWQVDRLRRDQPEAALALLKSELARRPEAALEIRLAYPRLLVSAKRFSEARDSFAELLKRYPAQPDVLYALGLLSFQLRELEAAVPYLEQALKVGHPETDYLRLTLGQVNQELEREDEARRWYAAVGQGEHYLPAQVRLAVLDAKGDNVAQVLARMNSMGTTAQEKIQVALFQSQIARQQQRLDLAELNLDRALASEPTAPELLYERALVLEMQGKFAASERDLKAYLQEKPDDAQGLNALGYLLANRTTRYREALALIERAHKADPDNAMILDSLGWVNFKLGRYTDAVRYLQKAYLGLPDPEVAAHLGEALWQVGRKDEALAIWRKALTPFPQHEVLQETIKRLAP